MEMENTNALPHWPAVYVLRSSALFIAGFCIPATMDNLTIQIPLLIVGFFGAILTGLGIVSRHVSL